jgi:hypothetical protein
LGRVEGYPLICYSRLQTVETIIHKPSHKVLLPIRQLKCIGRWRWLVAPRSNGATAASGLQALQTGQSTSVLLHSESKQSNFSPKTLVHPSKGGSVRSPITLLARSDRVAVTRGESLYSWSRQHRQQRLAALAPHH